MPSKEPRNFNILCVLSGVADKLDCCLPASPENRRHAYPKNRSSGRIFNASHNAAMRVDAMALVPFSYF